MFAIEAVKAKHGDCLLVHWEHGGERRLAIVDGGPGTVYKGFLKPRLEALAGGPHGTLPVALMMLSHIDDDHINGLIELGEDIEAETSPVRIERAWFNSLEGLLDGPLPANPAQVVAAIDAVFGADDADPADPWTQKVLASVPQGQALDGILKRLGLADTLNDPYPGLVMRGLAPRNFSLAGLELTPVAPAKDAVEVLRKVWKQKRKDTVTAGMDDTSPYNLSSIVVVAEMAGKSMLLTGDALGSAVLEGLGALGWPRTTDGRYHFDLVKLPHHGSQNNVDEAFFGKVTADCYLVSGDHKKFPNPHVNAMEWLAAARSGEDYAVYCTYDMDYMRDIFGERFHAPGDGETSITVHLA